MILGNISQKIEGCQPRSGVFEVSAALGHARGVYPEIEREKRGTYYFSRVAKHGERRNAGLGCRTFETRPVSRLGCRSGLAQLRQQDYAVLSGDRQAIRIVCAIAQTSSYEPAAISLSEKALATA